MENTLAAPGAGFKDRSTGLIVFGILQLILGGLCALVIPLMFFGQVMAARATGTGLNFRMVIPSALMYLVLAAAFICIGVGSMKSRRWARALALILGWSWLVIGVVSMAFTVILMFQTFSKAASAQGAQAAPVWIPLLIASVILFVIFIILPAILVIFYQRKDVKMTCESRDPVVRWTDRLPLPVLALALWIGFGAFSMLFMPLAYNSALPVFGKIISGLPGTLLCLAIAAIWAYAAWAIYKLNPVGWWIVLVVIIIFAISAFVTFRNLELPELYAAMGYPQAQIEQMEKFSFGSGKFLSVWTLAAMLPFVGFLLFVKRYFPPTNQATLSA